MALQMGIKTKFGEDKLAYLKVENIRGDKNWLNFDVKGYISRDASRSGMVDIYDKQYGFVPSAEERWDKQAYQYVKTLSVYENAADVLEDETL